MKKIISCIALLLCAFVAQAADITEDFSSLAKGKYGASSEQSVTLPSGEWKALKMELKENSGVKQFTFTGGSSSYLITPALDDPGKFSVDWGSGGNNKLTISYSVNGGAWQQLAEISSGGSGAKSYGAKTGLDGQTNVRLRFVGSSSNTYVTKITVKSASVVPVDPDDPSYITEGDYSLQKWGSIDYPVYDSRGYNMTNNYYCDRHKVAVGADWIPNPLSRKYLNQVHYRIGASYTTPYYKIKGSDGPNELTLSAGFGLPVSRSMVHISGQWVRSKATGFVTENTFRINIGLTFNERWFAKWKVD